jgi:hypothetical protein
LHWKNISIEELLSLKKSIAWKTTFIEKITCIEKLISLKKNVSIENMFHIQNVTCKVIFGTWCKLMYKNFPFFIGKKLWKNLYNKGYLNQNFDIRSFHIYKLFVY